MSDINIKSSTVEKSLDLIRDFLQKIIGPTVDELGLMFADNLKLRRFKNQIKNLEKVKAIVETNRIDIKQVNLKILVPYLEGVSLEEDETLQEMWANLFANYIDSEKNLTLNIYPEILKQLSSNEVRILNHMKENHGELYVRGFKISEIEYKEEELDNLERLALLKEMPVISQYGGDFEVETGQYKWELEHLAPDKYYLTSLGWSLLNACTQ